MTDQQKTILAEYKDAFRKARMCGWNVVYAKWGLDVLWKKCRESGITTEHITRAEDEVSNTLKLPMEITMAA